MADDLVSMCCSAPVRAAGDTTQYYVCSGCRKPCNWTTRQQDEAWRALVELGDELQGEQ